MSGKHYGGVGESEQLISYGFDKNRVVSTREIGASDGALEECVAGDHKSRFGTVESDAAG